MNCIKLLSVVPTKTILPKLQQSRDMAMLCYSKEQVLLDGVLTYLYFCWYHCKVLYINNASIDGKIAII